MYMQIFQDRVHFLHKMRIDKGTDTFVIHALSTYFNLFINCILSYMILLLYNACKIVQRIKLHFSS